MKMPSVTLNVTDEFKDQLKQFRWVNWSQVAKEETMKKLIFEKYLKTGDVSDEDWEFCEKTDWHPVDELPLKKEFVEKISNIKKEKAIKLNSVSDMLR